MKVFNRQQEQRTAFQSNNWLKLHGLPMSRKRYARRDERIFRKHLGIPIPPKKEDDNWSLKKVTSMPTSKITVSKEEREQMNIDIGVVLGHSGSGISFANGIAVCHKKKVSFTMYITYYL